MNKLPTLARALAHALTIGLTLMLLLPQSAFAVVIFVVFENGYDDLARRVVAQRPEFEIWRLHEGRLFHSTSAADDVITGRILLHRPGWARWNIREEVVLSPQALTRHVFIVGSDMESLVTLLNDVNQEELAERQSRRNRRQLLDAWALFVVANQRPFLFFDTGRVRDEAFNQMEHFARGMTTSAHVMPLMAIRDRIFHVAPSLVPGHLTSRQLGIPEEFRFFATGLDQRDRLIEAAAPVWRPAPPLPVRSPAGRIVSLIVRYLIGDPSLQTMDEAGFILVYQALMRPLRPLWEPQWRQPVLWQRDPSVPAWLQQQEARTWGLNLLPGSLGSWFAPP